MLRRTLAGFVTACLIAAAACAADAPSPTVHCEHVIGVRDEPGDGFEVFLDAVALPTRQVLQVQQLPDGRYWAKTGLVVRAGARVDLDVVGEGLTEWGSPGVQGREQHVPACGGDGWIAFAGGYTVAAPTCLTLRVRARGDEEEARIAVGAPCP